MIYLFGNIKTITLVVQWSRSVTKNRNRHKTQYICNRSISQWNFVVGFFFSSCLPFLFLAVQFFHLLEPRFRFVKYLASTGIIIIIGHFATLNWVWLHSDSIDLEIEWNPICNLQLWDVMMWTSGLPLEFYLTSHFAIYTYLLALLSPFFDSVAVREAMKKNSITCREIAKLIVVLELRVIHFQKKLFHSQCLSQTLCFFVELYCFMRVWLNSDQHT